MIHHAEATAPAVTFNFDGTAPKSDSAENGDGKPAAATAANDSKNASTSFSFAAPATAPSSVNTESAAKDKTSAAPSFGGTAASASSASANVDATNNTTTPTGSSTTSGFTFSASTTPTTKAPATPGAPAPVSTPSTTTKDSNLPTAAPAAPAVAPVPAPPQPPPLEYQTLTIEEILNKFERQLEEDALAFNEEAKRVCEYDAILRDAQRDLVRLNTAAQRLLIEQEQIENGLDTIGAYQYNLDKILTEVESQVSDIFKAQSHLSPMDADLQRERAYEMAQQIDYQLSDIKNSLRDTYDNLNQAGESIYGKGGDNNINIADIETANDVITVLNRHQDELVNLEAAAQKLDLDCNEVSAVLQTTPR